MEQKKLKEIVELISRYALKPATKRDLPLFTFCCIAVSYIDLLKKALSFSYKAVAAIGGRGKFFSMFNENYVVTMTGRFLESGGRGIVGKVSQQANEIFKYSEAEFIKAEKERESLKER